MYVLKKYHVWCKQAIPFLYKLMGMDVSHEVIILIKIKLSFFCIMYNTLSNYIQAQYSESI